MARKSHRRRHRTRRHRHMRGGKGAALGFEPVSGSNGGAAGYVSNLVGGLDQQINGALVGSGPGNELVINTQQPIPVNMAGGRRRRHRHSRRYKRGGNLGPVLYEAAVPLTLFAAQQMYKRKGTRRTRKH